jgi:CheY-like chemotaxis protein
MGNELRIAHDGADAVKVASEFLPELILLDIGMPKMNGYDACRQIRQQAWATEVVIVALTGWGQDDDRRRSTEAGFNEHLVKPVDIATVKQLFAGLKAM